MNAYLDMPEQGADNVPRHHMTARQEWIWLFMLAFQEREQRPPTLREVSAATHTQTRACHEQMCALVRKGFAEKVPHKARTTVAIDPAYMPTGKVE